MLQNIKEQVSARKQREYLEGVELEFLKLSAPLLQDFEKLALTIAECAKKSAARYDTFRGKYPFYGVERKAPAFSALKLSMDFLADVGSQVERLHAMDLYLLSRWADGPGDLKHLLSDRAHKPYEGVDEPTENERAEAATAFRQLVISLEDDLIPMLKPLAKLVEKSYAAVQVTQERMREIGLERPRLRFAHGYAPQVLSVCSALTWVVSRGPNWVETWQKAGVDPELMSRSGSPPPPPRDTDRFVMARQGFQTGWLPAAELGDDEILSRLRKLEDLVLSPTRK